MMRKYQKTEGFYVYAHVTPDGLFYIGMSKQQPYERWRKCNYKSTALQTYIEKYGWDKIRHFIFKDGLTREQALQLEDLLIQEATKGEYCINKQRSGLIYVTNKNAYYRQHYATNEEYREKRKVYDKQRKQQRRETPEGKIYNRVSSYNQRHPDLKIETPKEAKQKYLDTGYIPTYIKNNDL